MKNLFLITDGPRQDIYITNDEEIKQGDWFYVPNQMMGYENISKEWFDGLNTIYAKKIILTTNQDLIKDGVQSIPNEFLKWFANNPSCEKVNVEKEQYYQFVGSTKLPLIPNYKIIIPKELK